MCKHQRSHLNCFSSGGNSGDSITSIEMQCNDIINMHEGTQFTIKEYGVENFLKKNESDSLASLEYTSLF